MNTHFSRPAAAPPARRAVATFRSYEDAERAVDRLADQGFPVERVAIVGRDLKLVEQVTARMTYGRAALGGALSGAVVGYLIGWLFGVFNWFDPVVRSFWLAFDGLWFGAVLGALIAVLLYAASGGRRDFVAMRQLSADHFDVVVDDEVADEAQHLIADSVQ